MTGHEALQALMDGKKVTLPDIRKMYANSNEEFYVQVFKCSLGFQDMVWMSTTGEEVITNPSTLEYGNLVDASLFLRDDWTEVE